MEGIARYMRGTSRPGDKLTDACRVESLNSGAIVDHSRERRRLHVRHSTPCRSTHARVEQRASDISDDDTMAGRSKCCNVPLAYGAGHYRGPESHHITGSFYTLCADSG